MNETSRLRPDCEINNGEFKRPDMSSQARLFGFEPFHSIFQVPSTDSGALRCRPLRKTPASANNGKPTRRMYATTKFLLVRDIEPNLGEEVKKRKSGSRPGFLKVPEILHPSRSNGNT